MEEGNSPKPAQQDLSKLGLSAAIAVMQNELNHINTNLATITAALGLVNDLKIGLLELKREVEDLKKEKESREKAKEDEGKDQKAFRRQVLMQSWISLLGVVSAIIIALVT